MAPPILPPGRILGKETLEGLGNTLGKYVKYSKPTKLSKYITYATICVYMNIAY